ncbi:hypothetical protein CLAIMM_06219 [Cladophialophora immunda]|nr:hypothetical protein CLAIMM_06219 [Cladophialophora immunda]
MSAHDGEEALRSFDVPLFIEGDDENAFHTQNSSMSDYERANVIERTQGDIHTRCELLDVIHGTLDEVKKTPATLMIFKFRFDPQKQARRVKRVRIGMEFYAATATGATPVVYAIAPEERWTIMPTVDHEDVERSATVTIGSPPTIPVNASATAGLKKTVARDISDATTITGSIDLGEGVNSGTSNCAAWNILENTRRKTGVPDSVQVVVLLSRKGDERFDGRVTLEVEADFKTRTSEKLSNRKISLDDPVLFNPSLDPDTKMRVYEKARKYGTGALGAIPLYSLCTVRMAVEASFAITGKQ